MAFRHFKLVLRLILAMFAIGLIATSPIPLVAQSTEDPLVKEKSQPQYVLGAGDKVRVSVFGERDLSGTFEVNGLGYISLPLVGEIRAKDATMRGLETLIVTRLKEGFLNDPKVSVEVLNYRPFYILGEIRNPGSYPYVNGVTILKSVAMAGGFTYRANKQKILIIRATDPSNKKQLVGEHDIILPGDIITVQERFF
ncbi:MAG: polysaccharide export protein [Rhodospirillaceae bacterium]|jgi:protein involved in polysaccharide export with SLBB domain|nr:polysaccharide export protein [Rhodospirillaceae bacterium]